MCFVDYRQMRSSTLLEWLVRRTEKSRRVLTSKVIVDITLTRKSMKVNVGVGVGAEVGVEMGVGDPRPPKT